jgi:hypothetical protein
MSPVLKGITDMKIIEPEPTESWVTQYLRLAFLSPAAPIFRRVMGVIRNYPGSREPKPIAELERVLRDHLEMNALADRVQAIILKERQSRSCQ